MNYHHSHSVDPAVEMARAVIAEAARRPALAQLLLRRPSDWVTRLAARLRGLRMPRLSRLGYKLSAGLAAAALAFSLAGPLHTAHAGTIIVGGGCTLADAIISANFDTDAGGCTGASGGPDTISLTADVTLTGNLQDLTTNITIEGNNHAISGDNTYRIFTITDGADITLRNLTVKDGNGNVGGGIVMIAGASSALLTVYDSVITANTATAGGSAGGGGLYVNGYYAGVTIHNSTISNNTASAGSGGGILVTNQAGLNLYDSTVTLNSADGYGGGIFNDGGYLWIFRSAVTYNQTTGSGGGVAMVNPQGAGMGNTTVYQNTAVNGGGMYIINGIVSLANVTVVGNAAQSIAGGLLINTEALRLKNSIISNNTAGGSPSECFGLVVVDDGFNIETGTSCGFTQPSSYSDSAHSLLNLGPLDNNGTKPHPYTLALGAGSLAIDKIPPTSLSDVCNDTAPFSLDQRGGVRAGGVDADDAANGGIKCDIGAFEFTSNDPTAVTVSAMQAVRASGGWLAGIGAAIAGLLAAAGLSLAALRRRRAG